MSRKNKVKTVTVDATVAAVAEVAVDVDAVVEPVEVVDAVEATEGVSEVVPEAVAPVDAPQAPVEGECPVAVKRKKRRRRNMGF